MEINKTYLNNTYVACHILLSIFITIIIGGVELSGLDAVQLVMFTVLSYLIYINFELFFRLKKEEYKRVITNNMKLFFNSNLNNLKRKNIFFPWIISSVIIIIIITIIRCIFYIFRLYFGEINWEYLFVYIYNEPYLYIVIIVVVPQIVLFTILLSKRSSNEIGYLIAYILTLRIAFLLLLNIFFAYNINEIIFLVSVYDIISRSDILGKISTSLQPKTLITVLDGLITNWYNQLDNYLISKYKSIYFNKIIPFQYRLLSESSCNKVSLVRPKLLGSGYYRSQFQPVTLPQVLSLPSLSRVGETFVCNLKDGSTIGSYWNGETVVGSEDGSTIVSSCDGETVVWSESNLDVKNFSNIVKLRDLQLNFSPQYLAENRLQTIYVNKGKGIATNLDLNSDNEDNFESILENTGSNEHLGSDNEDINMVMNESRQTYRYNTIIGESSSRGAQGLYGETQNNSSSNSDFYENIDLDKWADELSEGFKKHVPITSRSSSFLSSISSSGLNELELELEFERAEEYQGEQNLPQGSNSSSSDLSSLDIENFQQFELDFSDLITESSIPADISDYNLNRCEEDFRSFMETLNIADFFNSELLNRLKASIGQDENGNINLDFSDSDISETNNSSSEEVIPIDRRVKTKKSNPRVKKPKNFKNKYYEMSYLLSMRKNNLLGTIKISKDIKEKPIMLEKINKLYEEILGKLRENKASDANLESMRDEIYSFSENILGLRLNKKSGPLAYRLRGAVKKEIFVLIRNTRSHVSRRIQITSGNDKDIKLKAFHKEIEKLRSKVKQDSSSTDNNLKNKAIAKLNKLKLDFQNNIKWNYGRNRGVFLVSNNDSRLNLLLLLYYKIRLELIRPFSVQMRPRIFRAPLFNRKDVYLEFINEIRILQKEMYSSSNIKDALHIVLKRLILLNEKHNYETLKDYTINTWNLRIVMLLKKILKEVIKS